PVPGTRNLRCTRVVKRPTEERQNDRRGRHDKKRPPLFEFLPPQDRCRREIQFHGASTYRTQRQADRLTKQVRRARQLAHWSRLRDRYVSERIKEFYRHLQFFLEKFAHV